MLGEEFAITTQNEDSKTAYALSLYNKISSISWDYSAADGTLAGYISNASTQEVEAFDFATYDKTPFDVAGQLWGKIAESMNKGRARGVV